MPPLYPHPNNLPEINVLSYHVYKDQTYAHHQCIPFSKSQINKRRILINLKALTLKSSINLDSREIPVEQNDSTYNSSGTESNDHSLKQNQIFSLPPQGNAVDNKLQKANFASGRTGPDIDTCRSPQVKFDLRVETLKLMRH